MRVTMLGRFLGCVHAGRRACVACPGSPSEEGPIAPPARLKPSGSLLSEADILSTSANAGGSSPGVTVGMARGAAVASSV